MMSGSIKPAMSSARTPRRRGRGAPMADINVTPFVDVMLVLLIIFMVSAPLMTSGVPVDLPETQAAALPQPAAPPTVVSIDARGEVFVGEDAVSLGGLAGALIAAAPEGLDERVYLRADGEVAYARVAEVMAELYGGGFRNIAFVSRTATTQEPQ